MIRKRVHVLHHHFRLNLKIVRKGELFSVGKVKSNNMRSRKKCQGRTKEEMIRECGIKRIIRNNREIKRKVNGIISNITKKDVKRKEEGF